MPATTLQLGDTVPAFSLPDTDGAEHHVPLAEAPPATVLVVTCLHCPFVIAWNPRLRAVAEGYAPRGVAAAWQRRATESANRVQSTIRVKGVAMAGMENVLVVGFGHYLSDQLRFPALRQAGLAAEAA